MAIIHEPGPGGKGGRSTRALAVSSLIDIGGFSAIDLGSKEGYNSFDLHECGASNVLGIEIRDSFLEEAARSRGELGYDAVSFRKADVRMIDELGLGSFDLCLCSGLLYHMQNPFNLLKRLRNICRYLALETHVAPSFFNYFRTGIKYRTHLQFWERNVLLDGEAFRGRLNIFPAEQDMQNTSGSVVSHATFWPTRQSLLRALDLVGFDLEAVYFGSCPPGKPPISIDHGVTRTKIFLLARNRQPGTVVAAGESRIEGCPELLMA